MAKQGIGINKIAYSGKTMKELDKAIELRGNGDLRESNKLLVQLANNYPKDALINYQCAWSFDVLGEEAKAVPYYENAIKLGLPKNDLKGALLGLGSTYRTLGEYEKSKGTFLKGIELFPHNMAMKVFYSKTLYNLQEHDLAMKLLIKCLLETTTDSEILSYYVTKWIESGIPEIKKNSLGKVSLVVLDEAHKKAVLEIAHVKELMRSEGVEVLERESREKDIWLKYRDKNEVYEAVYPKMILLLDVKWQLESLMRF